MTSVARSLTAGFGTSSPKLAVPKLAVILASLVLLAAGAALFGDGLRIKAKAVVAQALMERAWADRQAGAADARPWAWADVTPIARLIGPDGESDIVLSGVSGEAMAFGPGHMAGTPYPGLPGLSVLAAHRDTHFRYLKDIEPGDVVRVETDRGAIIAFRVVETRIVDAADSGLSPIGDTARIALTTCYPFNAVTRGPLRFVAIAERIGGPDLSLAAS